MSGTSNEAKASCVEYVADRLSYLSRSQACDWVDSGAWVREVAAIINGVAAHRNTQAAVHRLRMQRNGPACLGMLGEMLAATEALMCEHWPSMRTHGADLLGHRGLVEAKTATFLSMERPDKAQVKISAAQLQNSELAEFAITLIGYDAGAAGSVTTHLRVPAAEMGSYTREKYPKQVARGGAVTITVPLRDPSWAQWVYYNFKDLVDRKR